MTTPATPKVQIISANEVPELIEKILFLRNPELSTTRRINAKKRRARVRNYRGIKITGHEDLDSSEQAHLATIISLGAMSISGPKMPVPGRGVVGRHHPTTANISDLNRDINDRRVNKYLEAMLAGRWVLTADAIAISPEGLVINGQHRLAAAHRFATEQEHNGDTVWPQFILAWGIQKEAALFMDEARRSTDDRRSISLRYTQV